MKTRKYMTLAALVGTVVLGCDDDSSSGSAGTCTNTFAACGGDISGTWTIDGACVEGDLPQAMYQMSDFPAACEGMYQSADFDVSGTSTFANGTQTSMVHLVLTAKMHVTGECLSAIAGTTVPMSQAICDAFATQITGQGQTGSPESTTATCTLGSSACDCTIVQDNGNVNETQSYTVSGSTLTFPADGSTQQFCVSGTTATVREQTSWDGVAIQYTAHK